MPLQVAIDNEKIADFCRRHHIRRLAFFGSVLGARFGPESDVDVLVEFEPGHVPGLIGMGGLPRQLSEILGNPLDLRTPEDLSRYFRDEVLDQAEAGYEACGQNSPSAQARRRL